MCYRKSQSNSRSRFATLMFMVGSPMACMVVAAYAVEVVSGGVAMTDWLMPKTAIQFAVRSTEAIIIVGVCVCVSFCTFSCLFVFRFSARPTVCP